MADCGVWCGGKPVCGLFPCMGDHDPGCYCGCRPVCEGFVNCCLLPFLGSGCGKCLIKRITGPLWRSCDIICGRPRNPDRPSGLKAIQALVVLTIRPVKDVDEYKRVYAPYATKVQASTPGVRAFFSFMDKSNPTSCLQVGWYDSPEVLAAIAKDPAVEACYDASGGKAWGAVYGNRNDVTQAALATTGVAYEYGSLPRGFMKSAPHKGFDPELYPGPPMIWMSKRWVQPGRNPNIAKAFAKVGDLQYHAAPAFLSGFEYSAPDNPDQLWSLRWFNDYEMGHVAHFPKSLVSNIPTRVLFDMIPNLKGGLGAEYPVGLSFSTKADIDKAIKYNGGNKAYDQHYWEDVIGPVPEMGKGMGKNAAAVTSQPGKTAAVSPVPTGVTRVANV